MYTEILFHNISYYYSNDQKMSEYEEEHVKEMIFAGYYQGELNDFNGETEVHGWWHIHTNGGCAICKEIT